MKKHKWEMQWKLAHTNNTFSDAFLEYVRVCFNSLMIREKVLAKEFMTVTVFGYVI